jgi:hypothetical protein
MINKHLFRLFIIASIVAIALPGCKKETVGSVTGTITAYDPSNPLQKNPLASIRVYLVNMDFNLDMVNKGNNKAALIDSIYTDVNGKYSFTSLPEGAYSVHPFSSVYTYLFAIDNTWQSTEFSIAAGQTTHEINFTAPIPGGDNNTDSFTMTIISENRPTGAYIKIFRQTWMYFAIFLPKEVYKVTLDSESYSDQFGFTSGVYSYDNVWSMEAWENKSGQMTLVHTYALSWDLVGMPYKPQIYIDWKTQGMRIVE